MTRRCEAPGCTKRAVHGHHAVKETHIRRAGGDADDPRWRIPLCVTHHFNHEHAMANRKLPLAVVPDVVFDVAVETFGAGRAYEEIRRYYAGEDIRLTRLLEAA